MPPVVQRVVWNTMSLKEDTTGYKVAALDTSCCFKYESKIYSRVCYFPLKVWLSPPVPVYTKFYFFNVVNPEDVENGEIPQVFLSNLFS